MTRLARSVAFHWLVPLCLMVLLMTVAPWALSSGGAGTGPTRPVSVPKSAYWLGGSDGGVFVQLSSTDTRRGRSYRGTIYRDHGGVWYRGPFVVEPAGSAPVDVKNLKQFAGWDGMQLLLQDGRALVAGKPR